MSKKEKLEDRIRRNPQNVSLDDFESLVCQYGRKEKGGKATLTYKRANPMPIEYVTDLLDIIDNL
jgi:hypothetical protein